MKKARIQVRGQIDVAQVQHCHYSLLVFFSKYFYIKIIYFINNNYIKSLFYKMKWKMENEKQKTFLKLNTTLNCECF